jgi:hypothetical protein
MSEIYRHLDIARQCVHFIYPQQGSVCTPENFDMADQSTLIYSLLSVAAASFLILKLAKAIQPDVCMWLALVAVSHILRISWITFRRLDRQDYYRLTLVPYGTFDILDKLLQKDARR